MLERPLARLQDLLRIPSQPDPPAGSPESTRVFRAARGFYYRRLIEWALAQWGAFFSIYFGLTATGFIPERIGQYIGGWIRIAEGLAIALFVIQLVLSLVAVHLGFRLRWYIVTDRSLRIREGIWRVREQTVSFANIQNVAVRQGPLQRFLGIADVEIRTAGGGESGSDSGKNDNLHRAVFRGVDNAAEIRDLIRSDLRRLKQAPRPRNSAGDAGNATSGRSGRRNVAAPSQPPASGCGRRAPSSPGPAPSLRLPRLARPAARRASAPHPLGGAVR